MALVCTCSVLAASAQPPRSLLGLPRTPPKAWLACRAALMQAASFGTVCIQFASQCRHLAWTAVCMIGKRASPKNRLVCNVCTAWLLEEDLALMLSPRSLSIRSAHGPLQIFNVAKDIWTT